MQARKPVRQAGKPGKLESWKAGKPGKPESKKKRKLEKSVERLRTTLPPGIGASNKVQYSFVYIFGYLLFLQIYENKIGILENDIHISPIVIKL